MAKGWRLNRKARCHPDKPHFCKGLCRACYKRANRPKYSPERGKIFRRDYSDRIKRYAKRADVKRKFGITLEEYEERRQSQAGICGICKLPMGGLFLSGEDDVLDHDHKTGAIREFVHRRCNTGLGQFKDSAVICRMAADYLDKHREK